MEVEVSPSRPQSLPRRRTRDTLSRQDKVSRKLVLSPESTSESSETRSPGGLREAIGSRDAIELGIEEFIEMGQEILEFIQLHPAFSRIGEDSWNSVYVQGICQGLTRIWDLYFDPFLKVKDLAALDSEFGFQRAFNVLRGILLFVRDLKEKQARGAQVYDILHDHFRSGYEDVSVAVISLWNIECNSILLRQIMSWCLSADLIRDPFHEFFVRKSYYGNFHDLDQITLGHRVPVLYEFWSSRYHVHVDLCPQYLRNSVAEHILFSGKAMELVRFLSGRYQFGDLERALVDMQERAKSLVSVKESYVAVFSNQSNFRFLNFEQMAKRDIKQLDAIYTQVDAILWKLLFNKGSVIGKIGEIIRSFRGFYLLGNGHFYETFVTEAISRIQRMRDRSSRFILGSLLTHRNLIWIVGLRETFAFVAHHAKQEDHLYDRFSLRSELPDCDDDGFVQLDNSDLLFLGNSHTWESPSRTIKRFVLGKVDFEQQNAGQYGSLWNTRKISSRKGFESQILLNIACNRNRPVMMSPEEYVPALNGACAIMFQNQTLDVDSLPRDSEAGYGSFPKFEPGSGFSIKLITGKAAWVGATVLDEDEYDNLCFVAVDLFGYENDSTSQATSSASFELPLDESITIDLKYDSTSESLSVQIAGSQSSENLADISVSVPDFLKKSTGWLGFTAGSSDLSTRYEVESWTVNEYFSQESSGSRFWRWIVPEFSYKGIHESVFFGVEEMSIYTDLFKLLFELNYVNHQLKAMWKMDLSPRIDVSAIFSWKRIKYKMCFVVDFLLEYFMSEVVETEYKSLMVQLAKCDSFTKARELHRNYLNNISWKCFTNKTVQYFLMSNLLSSDTSVHLIMCWKLA